MSCFYFVERKAGVPLSESYIRALCKECKTKLYPNEKMMFYSGKFGPFDVKCHSCRKVIHPATPQED